eukprot:5660204-Pleurochrysis_carterae.AAC.2
MGMKARLAVSFSETATALLSIAVRRRSSSFPFTTAFVTSLFAFAPFEASSAYISTSPPDNALS